MDTVGQLTALGQGAAAVTGEIGVRLIGHAPLGQRRRFGRGDVGDPRDGSILRRAHRSQGIARPVDRSTGLVRFDRDVNSIFRLEDEEPEIAIAGEDVGLAVANEGLDSPDIVALRAEVATDLDELTGGLVARVGAPDLDHPDAAGVVRQVRAIGIERIGRDFVDRQVAVADRECRVMGLVNREGIELGERLPTVQVDIPPAVEDGADLDVGTDGTDGRAVRNSRRQNRRHGLSDQSLCFSIASADLDLSRSRGGDLIR